MFISFEDVAREGLGEALGLGEPRRAKRAARSSGAPTDDLDGIIAADGVVSNVTLDFLRALSRARSASSGVSEGEDGIWGSALGIRLFRFDI